MVTCSNCAQEIDGDFVFCPHCGAELTLAPLREQRKTVTVLFCDVTGSTSLGESLDPEALRSLFARYFERMKGIVERHGGTVEKFIGDAVVAVFGVPETHEDDALRAARAAVEMRDALPEIGVQARIGVNTGEVVTGTEERLVTGDPVNVAARLEQASPPGGVLIGGPTLALLRDAAEVEPLPPLELKGKANPEPAYRLLKVLDPPVRSQLARFVGRRRELTVVRDAWDRVQTDRRCELVTVVGEAGIGKSRLATEVLTSLRAMVVRGRCLPYGEGITYWPVVEVLKQLPAQPEDEAAATSIRSLLRESEAATTAEEIAWAFRKTLERSAARRPLVVVFDDIQWGEETFLDLIEHIPLLSTGAPILVLCMARPELVDCRSSWPVTVRLGPLGDEEVDELIPGHVVAGLRKQIARASGGNPLFVEEILAIAGDSDGELVVPPTLHALLQARLDQLDPAERNVLELGAVEGEVFHRGAVQALAPDETRVTPLLAALARRGLIAPHAAQLPGEDGFRFRHLLIRDAAYRALPKATRAGLHQRFASWLVGRGTGLAERDEIIGFHLEQAHRFSEELGMPRDERLADAARRRLTAAGRRAYLRGDFGAAVGLLHRASGLTPPSEIDLLLETTFADTLFVAGRGAEAIMRADATAARASAAGEPIAAMCAKIQAVGFRANIEPEGTTDELETLVGQALPVFESAGADLPLFVAFSALGSVEATRGRMDAMIEAMDRAVDHAREIGLPPHLLGWRASGRIEGTTPASEALAWLEEQESREPNGFLPMFRAHALAMLGRFEEARALLTNARAEFSDRGADIALGAMLGLTWVEVERLAGDPVAAVEVGLEGCKLLDELGEHAYQSTAAGYLAQALYTLNRLSDAEQWAGRAAGLGASDDVLTQMLWRQVRAKVLARGSRHAEAQSLIRRAIAIAEDTDAIDSQAWAYEDLAEVLSLCGRTEEARHALEEAVTRYERKGNVVMVARTHDRLATIQGHVPW